MPGTQSASDPLVVSQHISGRQAVRPVGQGIDSLKRRNPASVKMAYTPDSIWRNRDEFLQGRDAIEKFLTDKWSVENGYRLRKELFAFKDNKVLTSRFVSMIDSLGRYSTFTDC